MAGAAAPCASGWRAAWAGAAVHAPVLSTAADGLHSSHASNGPIVENCMFERMGDDGIAIHGSYQLVVSSPNNTTVILAASGSWGKTPVQVGDRLWLYDPKLRPIAELQVASFAPMAPSYLPSGNPASRSLPKRYHQAGPFLSVRLTKALPSADHLGSRVGFDWLVSNANRTGNSFALRNNTVRDNHARAVNLKASEGDVLYNTFSGNFHGTVRTVYNHILPALAEFKPRQLVCMMFPTISWNLGRWYHCCTRAVLGRG